MKLPPCIKTLLERGAEGRAREVVLAYLKEYQPKYSDVAELVGDGLAGELFREAMDFSSSFSCFNVAQVAPGVCNIIECPLVADDPVSLLLGFADKILYNRATRELKIYFYGKDEPLIIPVKSIASDRRTVLGEIAAFTLELFNVPLILRTYKTEDGERVDQLQQLITQAFGRAVVVREDDVGVSELITELYNLYPPADLESAKDKVDLPESFIYIDTRGKYFAVLARIVRQKARSVLGISSIRKLSETLRRFGIEKRQLMVGRKRGYYYLVPANIFRELTGEELKPTIVEFDEAIASIERTFDDGDDRDDWSYLQGGDGG